MWIEHIFVEHFGLYKGLSIQDLSPGLTLLVGPNEAGKSSLLEFIRSVFFGFRYRSARVNTYEPPDGAGRAGWVAVRVPDGDRLRIQRIERPAAKEGILTVWDHEGNSVETSVVPLFRPGMDRRLYENLFAFDLDQMRHLDKQTLRARIVSAALGSLDVNPLDVAKKLDERLKALGKRSKRDDGALHAIQSKIEDINKRLHALEDKPAHYTSLREDLLAADTRRQELVTEIRDTEHHLQGLNRIVRYETEWKRLTVVENELAELSDVATFPADGASRLDRLLDRKRDAEEALAQREKDLEHVREGLNGIAPDRAILTHADRIHVLARQARSLSDRPAYLDRQAASVAAMNAELDRDLSDLGKGWTREKLVNADPSVILEQRIRSVAEAWQSLKEKIHGLETRLFDCADAMAGLERKTALKEKELRDIAPYCRGFLDPGNRERLGEWKECARRVEDLQERLQEKKRRIDVLVEERMFLLNRLQDKEQEDASLIPGALFWPVMLLWVMAGSVLEWSGYHSTAVDGFAYLAVGGLMLVALPFAVIWRMRTDRARCNRVAAERDALKRQLDSKVKETLEVETGRRQLMLNIRQFQKYAQGIAASVLGNPLADHQDVARAERDSAAAEEHVRKARGLEENIKELHADRELGRQRETQIQGDLQQVRGKLAELKEQWQEMLRNEGFDRSLQPESALETLRLLRNMKNTERVLVEQGEAFAAAAEEWASFVQAVSSLAQDLGAPDSDASPLDVVEQWDRAEIASRESLTLQRDWEERERDLVNRVDVLRTKVHDTDRQVRSLLLAARVEEEEAFRSQAMRHQRHESLRDERRVLTETLTTGLKCADSSEMRLRVQARDWDADKSSIAMLQSRLQRLRDESEDLAARRGRLEREIQVMEAQEETEQLTAEREEWHTRLREGVTEWLTFRLARLFLERTLDVYETEKQPKVLEKSSAFLRKIAGETFSRILLPMDRDHVLVERGDGTRVQEEHLSRGTLEQVYLALRLAHIEVYHKGELAFPLMMDDVLVNFDPGRGRSTAATLARFSEDAGVQILIFTCHPSTADLFPGNTRVVDMGSS